ncbi:MAG: AI-2E family transporter, partial [Mesorhizobium sp.]
PHARLYQRLLAGDPEEATDHAEEMLEEKYLFDFYDKVAIAALLLGEQDRVRGVMGDEQRRRVAASAQMLVANLDDIAREEAEEDDDPATVEPATADKDKPAQAEGEDDTELPDGTDIAVLCAGGRGELDDAAAAMLAQVLEVQGATVSKASFADMDPTGIRRLELDAVDTVVVGFL